MGRANGAYGGGVGGRGCCVCGEGTDRGGEAKGAGCAGAELTCGAGLDSAFKTECRLEGGLGRDVQRVERYCDEGGTLYGNTIPAVGGHEEVENEDQGHAPCYSGREWYFWEFSWGGGGWGDDALRCLEDEDDVGAREAGFGAFDDADFEGVWTEGLLCGYRTEDIMDICRWCYLSRKLPMDV